jgi:type I restriction enzyme S subunit
MGGLYRLAFPIPPLSEQQRIVDILDTFTSSIENLKEQIAQRRKQYEYYRDQLLDLEGKEGVEMKVLGDFCDTLSGFPFDSSKFSDDGIQLMRGANIKRGYFDFSQELNKYWASSEGLEKSLLEPNDIIISMDGSLVGRSFCYLRSEHKPFLLVQRVARIRTKENFKYVYYNITKSFSEYVDKKKTAGAIPHISMKDINSFTIPVPSLSEQQRIVSILDTFEASIQNLEAQLSQREKQYEYYRNKLLTFE